MATDPAFDFHRLSIAQRLELVESIWDSIAADADEQVLPLTDEERAMLDQRLSAHEQNPSETTPWAEARARILGKRS